MGWKWPTSVSVQLVRTHTGSCIWGFLIDARISGVRQKAYSSSEETEALLAGLKAAPGLDRAEWIGRGSRPLWDPGCHGSWSNTRWTVQ